MRPRLRQPRLKRPGRPVRARSGHSAAACSPKAQGRLEKKRGETTEDDKDEPPKRPDIRIGCFRSTPCGPIKAGRGGFAPRRGCPDPRAALGILASLAAAPETLAQTASGSPSTRIEASFGFDSHKRLFIKPEFHLAARFGEESRHRVFLNFSYLQKFDLD